MRIEKRGQTIENIDVITIKFVPDHIGLVLNDGGVIPAQFGHSDLAFFNAGMDAFKRTMLHC